MDNDIDDTTVDIECVNQEVRVEWKNSRIPTISTTILFFPIWPVS